MRRAFAGPVTPPDAPLREFLFAQLTWERYHASRVRLLNLSAAAGAALWLAAALGHVPPLLLAALPACFLCAAFAALMELRWRRRVERSSRALQVRGEPR